MKLCYTCEEYDCSLRGTHSASMFCGDKNFKLQCYVYSDDKHKAIEKILEETKEKTIIKQQLKNQNECFVETETEKWKWLPLHENVKAYKPNKAFVDNNTSIDFYNRILLPAFKFSCLDGYPKFF